LTSFEAESKGKTDEIEERLITEVESVQEKHEEKINKEKHYICQLTSILKDNKQELEFVKDHIYI
jgi:ribulose 1,5-bisphosphate carboxylase large subunit-like protein